VTATRNDNTAMCVSFLNTIRNWDKEFWSLYNDSHKPWQWQPPAKQWRPWQWHETPYHIIWICNGAPHP